MDLDNLVLRPNCLLTRAPLVFLTGSRSLFHYQKLAASLQVFIEAHGYQVITVPLPFRGPALRKKALQQWLQKKPEKSFHFIAGPQTAAEFSEELKILKDSTLTVIGDDFKPLPQSDKLITPLNYRLHQLFCWVMNSPTEEYAFTLSNENRLDYDRFLDHCVQLAENEVICRT